MAMTKTILVLGTNAGQADLIRHMKARGWRVIGVSPIVGESGQAFCDVVEHVNIVDLDALEAVAKRHAVDLVYSISSDLAMKSVIALSERLGLPHFYDSAFFDLLDNKAALRDFLNTRNLSHVPFVQVASVAEAAGWDHYPCIVKPTDGQGQRGVVRLDGPEGLEAAVSQAIKLSRAGHAIIEAFLEGVEISCNVMISDGVIRMKVLSERLVHTGLAVGLPRGHLVPAKAVPAADQAAALAQVEAIIAAMNLDAGVLYFQMIVTPHGPRVVEIAPRLDGCHMWRLIKASQGVDLIEMTMDRLTETRPVATHTTRFDVPDMELMFQQQPPGTPFDPAAFPVPVDAVYHEYRYAPGQDVRAVNGTLEVVGYYVRATS